MREAALRIVQEALANAVKHAAARRVHIALETESGRPRLRVADDGAGFDARRATGGMGLSTMRERAEAIGAALSVVSSPGEGTQVEVLLA